jgi:glycosidase
MKKRIISFITLIVFVLIDIIMPQVASAAGSDVFSNSSLSSYSVQNNFNNGIILKAYNWSFNNIKNKLAEIKDAGYSIIEVSQVQGTKNDGLEYSNWRIMSQPINQKIGNVQLGTKEELKELCLKADEYGLKVIVEVEMNHMAFNDSKDGLNPLVDAGMQDIDLYHNLEKCTNWKDRWSVTQGDIDGMDLNTQNPLVQDSALSFLNDCVSIGVDGFKFSKASSIETELGDDNGQAWASDYWRYVLGNLISNRNNLIIYGDISNNGANNEEAYSEFMNISSEKSGDLLRTAITSKNLTTYNDYLSNGTISYYENPDSFNLGESSSLTNSQRKICWALIASRANTSPELFVRPGDKIGVASDDIFKDQDIKAINTFHSKMKNNSEYVKKINNNVMMIERGTQGAVIVNLGENTTINVPTNLEDGVYENKASSGGNFIVSNGKISGNLGKEQIAVFYKEKKVYFKNPLNWSKVSIFVYDDSSVNIRPWPGEQMTKEENGLYSYTFPEGWENKNSYVIFNDNGDVAKEAGHQIPETGLNGYCCSGNSMIYDGSTNGLLPYYKSGFIIGALSADKSSPCVRGENIQIMASAGGVSGNINYEFYTKKDNITKVIQSYSINNTVNWNPSEKGTYIVGVNVKDNSGNILNKEIQYEIKDAQSITGLNINKTSPQVTNSELVVQADAINGIGEGKYEFYTIKNGIEQIIKSYSYENLYTWIPTEKGHYIVGVRVKDDTGKVVSKEIEYDVYDPLEIKDLTLDKTLYQEQGKSVNITSNAAGGFGEVKYKFVAINGANSEVLQDYSSNNSISWTPSEVGEYTINVYVKDGNDNVLSKLQNITITSHIVINQFNSDMTIGQMIGNEINLSANVSGGAGTLKYKFVAKKGQNYQTIQEYSEKNTAKWIPTEGGIYTLAVEVKDELGVIEYKIIDNVEIKNFGMSSFTANLASPQVIGTGITFSTSSSGGIGILQTKFAIYDGSSWTLLKAYSADSSATWTPIKAGTYKINATVKDETGQTVTRQYDYTINSQMTINSFTSNLTSPQVVGAGITLSTSSSGGIGTLQTKFEINDGSSWTLLKAYSTDSDVTWTPTKAGTYTITTTVKDGNGNEVTKSMNYVVNDKPLAIDNFTASVASPQVVGTGITLSTVASGGTGTLQTKFEISDGTTTTVLKDYSTVGNVVWTPTKAGTYTVTTKVKDTTGKEVTKTLTYVINNITRNETTIYYNGYSTPYIHYRVGSGSWTSAPGVAMTATTEVSGYTHKITIDLGTASTLTACFNNGSGSWDSANGANYTFNAGVYTFSNGTITKIQNPINNPVIDTFTTSVASPQVTGTGITLSTTASGGTGTLETKFEISDGTTTTVLKDYSTVGNDLWTPTKVGEYTITATVKDTTGKEVTKTLTYVINNELAIDNFIALVTSPQVVGTGITLCTTASGGAGTLQTKFEIFDGTTTTVLKNYSTVGNVIWTPTQAGTYTIITTVKDGNGNEVTKSMNYVVNGKPLAIDTFTTSVASPQATGTGITLSTAASGGVGTLQTKFEIFDGTTTTILKDYSIVGNVVWTPIKAGTYTITTTVRDTTGKEVTKTLTYVINNITKNETTIYYKGYSTPYIHYKVGSGSWTSAPGVAMTATTEVSGYTHKITIDLGTASTLTACFNNGSGSWDSANGANYTFNAGVYIYSNGTITKK